jgi:hypothetical protein
VVERIEVDVGEQLARQVADRDAVTAPERGEEVVAGEVLVHRLLFVRTVDDPV